MKLNLRFWKQYTYLPFGYTVALLAVGVAQVIILHLLIKQASATNSGMLVRGITLVVLPFVANYIASQIAAYTTNRFQITLLTKLSRRSTNELEQVHPHVFSTVATLNVDHLFQFWKELFTNIGLNIPVLIYLIGTLLTQSHIPEIVSVLAFVVGLFGLAYALNQRLKMQHRKHHQAYITLQEQIGNYVENVLQFRLYHTEKNYLHGLGHSLTHFSKLMIQLTKFRQLYSTAISSILLFTLWGGLWLMQRNYALTPSALAVATLILLEIRRIGNEFLFILQTHQRAQESVKQLKPWLSPELTDELPKNQLLPAVPIGTKNLTFSYQGSVQTIQYPDFDIQVGERVWIKGTNGRGKSTLWKILAGLYTSSTTTVWLNKSPYHSDGLTPFWNRISAVTEPPRCYSGRLWEIIGNFSAPRETVVDWLSVHQLLPLFDTYSRQLDTYYDSVVNNLSAGQLKWLLLVQALFLKPDLLILDEPFSSLDADRQRVTLSLLNKLSSSVTLIVISHHQIPIEFTKTIQL